MCMLKRPDHATSTHRATRPYRRAIATVPATACHARTRSAADRLAGRSCALTLPARTRSGMQASREGCASRRAVRGALSAHTPRHAPRAWCAIAHKASEAARQRRTRQRMASAVGNASEAVSHSLSRAVRSKPGSEAQRGGRGGFSGWLKARRERTRYKDRPVPRGGWQRTPRVHDLHLELGLKALPRCINEVCYSRGTCDIR